jgi:hypothetical protein
MFNQRRLRNSVAETLREMGLLVAVFAPLDFLFSQGDGVAAGVVAAIATTGVALMTSGILVGARK